MKKVLTVLCALFVAVAFAGVALAADAPAKATPATPAAPAAEKKAPAAEKKEGEKQGEKKPLRVKMPVPTSDLPLDADADPAALDG